MADKKKVAIIGAGFSGLSAAAYLAAAGFDVHVYEKHSTPGGRARQFTAAGYTFDMGPSWYWMPDIFERFFKDMGSNPGEWYHLKLLDPSFEIVFAPGSTLQVPNNFASLIQLFESLETGAGKKLSEFMRQAQYKYEKAMAGPLYKPGLRFTELLDWRLLAAAHRFQLFSSFGSQVRHSFRHPHLVALMEFPVLFLGAMPADTPALYTMMNYAGLKMGTWYPEGGFGAVARAIARLAEGKGAKIHYNCEVSKIIVEGRRASGIFLDRTRLSFDGIVASADYNYVEQALLPPACRNYDDAYWNRKTFAPSCLIFYLGLRKKFPALAHHTLFFDEDLDAHSIEIYKQPAWPKKPLFYTCRTTASDSTAAPAGHDNLFLLMPIATGLEDSLAERENYFSLMAARIQKHIGEDFRPFIIYKRSYCVKDFIREYGAYKGNAYGLANTLLQTALFKPKIVNRRLSNLVYAGQLTVPGPGVPPALISGKLAAEVLASRICK